MAGQGVRGFGYHVAYCRPNRGIGRRRRRDRGWEPAIEGRGRGGRGARDLGGRGDRGDRDDRGAPSSLRGGVR